MSIHEMEAAARELRQLQALIEEAQAEADALKKALPDVAERFSIRSTTRRFSVT